MGRLAFSLNLEWLFVAGATGLFCIVVTVLYRAFSIRQRTVKLRKNGLVQKTDSTSQRFPSLPLPVFRTSPPHIWKLAGHERNHGGASSRCEPTVHSDSYPTTISACRKRLLYRQLAFCGPHASHGISIYG